MKKLIILLTIFFASLAAMSQTQTIHQVSNIAAMKSYFGNAKRIYVVSTNEDYVRCDGCTPDEISVFDGAGARNWLRVSTTIPLIYPMQASGDSLKVAQTFLDSLYDLIDNAGGGAGEQYFQSRCDYTVTFNPADNTTYYFGAVGQWAAPTTAANARTYSVPVNCTLIGYSIASWCTNNGTTTETSTIIVRIQNTTDIQLSNAVVFNTTSQLTNMYSSMAMSTDLNANDKYEIKWVTPPANWATNPTGTQVVVTLYFITR